jgi:hypothetical protein
MEEIDPKIDPAKMDQFDIFDDQIENQSTQNLLSEIFSSIPGIDSAMSFSKLMGYTYL